MRRPAMIAAVAGAGVLAFAVSGCATSPNSGPLGAGPTTRTTVCLEAKGADAGRSIVGFGPLMNPGSDMVTVTKVELGLPVNMEGKAWLLPDSTTVAVASDPREVERWAHRRWLKKHRDSPPPVVSSSAATSSSGSPSDGAAEESMLWRWSERQPAEGAVLPPGEPMQLVMQVTRPDGDRTGRARGVKVTYSNGWQEFTWLSGMRTVVGRPCS